MKRWSRISSVDIVTGYKLDGLVLISSRDMRYYLFDSVQNDSGTHPAVYPKAPEDHSLGVKPPGREAHHSHLSNAKDKNVGAIYIHSIPPPPRRNGKVLN